MRTRLISLLTQLLRVLFRSTTAPIDPPQRILIVKPCCLGDVLLTTPLVARIRSSFPDAQITYAVGGWSLPMVATSQHVDAVITLPERWTWGALLAVARAFRTRRFDVAFVPDRSPLLGVLVWLARIPQRVGLDSRGRGFAYTHRAPVTSIVQHEADLYNRLATAAGLPPPERRLHFFPTEEADQAAQALLDQIAPGDGPLMVLHAGGGANPGMTLPRKRWLPERWAAVAADLIRDGARLLLIGGPGDEAPVAAVQAALSAPAPALVQRWDWNDLGALLRRSDLFLGHDTGMMHLATAVGTRVVAVFGPSDPQNYGPYGADGAYVWRPTVQSPCFWDGVALPDCPCAMQCMRNVEVADVLRVIDNGRRTTDDKMTG